MCLHISQNVCVVLMLTLSTKRTSNQQDGLSDTQSRKLWYERSLELWNQDNTIRNHVIVIENSDTHYEMPYLEFINFKHSKYDEQKYCSKRTHTMGEHELISVHKGMSNAKRMKGATHVIKITGRYYIPGFAHMIQNLSDTHEIIHMYGYAGGCQVMGCRIDVCPSLWKCPYERFSHCEATVKIRMQKHEMAHRFELPNLHTAYTISGSAGQPVTMLTG